MRAAAVLALVAGCHALPPPVTPVPTGSAVELLQLGRAQDQAGLDRLTAALDDHDANARAMAAWAVGQLGVAWRAPSEETRARAQGILLGRLDNELDPGVRDRLIEALGKIGATRAVSELLPLLGGKDGLRAAVALGALAKRLSAQVPVEAIEPLAAQLGDKHAERRWAAAYALAQLKRAEARGALENALGDVDVLVRATAAKGLGDVAGDDAKLAPLLNDADVRVAGEAARALAKHALSCAPDADCAALDVLGAAAQFRAPVMGAIAFEEITHPAAVKIFAARYRGYAEAHVPDVVTRGLAQCQAALAHDRAAGQTVLTPQCGLGHVDERARGVLQARALADAKGHEETRSAALRALAVRTEPAVRTAAADGLGNLGDTASAGVLATLIADADPAVVAAAAGSIEKRNLTAAIPGLRARLSTLHGPDAIEAQEAILSALGALKATDAVDAVRALANGTNAAVCLAAEQALQALGSNERCVPGGPTDSPFAADRLPRDPRLRIVTTHGTIRVRLFPALAPSTVRNLYGLARKGYFDGQTFHRVVTGFVSQGGDPRGDGSGGPGWNIPCGINPQRYGEGTVGMALSGRDTGGSQFFITHTPQPHLDGRYTVFGEVTEGIDVAVGMSEGERIVEIRPE